MIPLKDDTPRFSTPYVTYFLLVFNIAIFLLQATQGPGANQQLAMVFGLIPVKIPIALAGGQVPLRLVSYLGTRYVTVLSAFLPILTSMFLHSGWWHIISNMWVLWIFGDNVEDYLGHFVYLLFYLGTGIAGALLHVMFNWTSVIPTVGASGAIAGVMGAYFVLYPKARVLTLVPFFFVFFALVVFEVGCVEDPAVGGEGSTVPRYARVDLEFAFTFCLAAEVVADVDVFERSGGMDVRKWGRFAGDRVSAGPGRGGDAEGD